jgi:hypothetical protein
MGCTAAMGVTFSSPRDHALRGAAVPELIDQPW